MSKKPDITFQIVDINEPHVVYGELILQNKTNRREWSFKLSDDITPESWSAFGLFPAELGTTTDSSYLEDLLLKRVPLKQRIQKDFEKHLTEKLVDIISHGGLQVASDSYRLVIAK